MLVVVLSQVALLPSPSACTVGLYCMEENPKRETSKRAAMTDSFFIEMPFCIRARSIVYIMYIVIAIGVIFNRFML